MSPPRRSEQGGFAAAEFVVFSGLIFLPLVILTAMLPTWIERQSLARQAAREAARTVALADDLAVGADRATVLTDELAANHNTSPDELTVDIDGNHRRGGEITATATVAVPSLPVPYVPTPRFTLTHTHAEQVDDYRNYDP
jgi:hypothetical protein